MKRLKHHEWTDEERIKSANEWMVRDKAKKAKIVKAAQGKERAAQEKVNKANSKIELEKAKLTLKMARLRRRTVEAQAKTALVNAQISLDRAKAAGVRASEQKWGARASRIRKAASGTKSLVSHIVVGNGGSKKKSGKGYLDRQHDSLIDW